MTIESATASAVTTEAVTATIAEFLKSKTKAACAADTDLFAGGLVSSMFAMQLVVFLEGSYDIAIVGPDLRMDNFRTIGKMTELVLRLKDDSEAAGDPADGI
ncbi:MAG: acyl carrier protein [Hamadaea sp.]|uniref:acyl carrier protein n=1 Tax=Hamadaea sp. TaxID=2024425 RepID=UPI00181B7883|nr:acyl carrier protein [Hamadaea sp.]NUR69277.1 acyl carrier protein [Hamadaea sp.]NUT22019.1 acyl carrier protein [Hamadaea sp.]